MRLSICIMALLVSLSQSGLVLAEVPKQVKARSEYMLAEELFQKEKYAETIEHATNARTLLGETNSKIEYMLCKAYFALNRYGEAHRAMEMFFQVTPESQAATESYNEMVLLYSRLEQKVEEEKKREAALADMLKEIQDNMVQINGGCFQMGSPAGEAGRDPDEGPVHEVCVDSFSMSKYEVTNEQYRKFVSGHNSKDYEGHSLNGKSQPAVYVSWDDAKAYAAWLSSKSGKIYRLPTEAEWEYAARGGTTSARFWGENADGACRYANVVDYTAKNVWSDLTSIHNCDDGHVVSSPVGSFKPNNFGLYDMLGNVWEWSGDWYGENYYSSSSRQNPTGPSSGELRVSRGGGWNDYPRYVRSANRDGDSLDFRGNYLGFRLVLQASAPGR